MEISKNVYHEDINKNLALGRMCHGREVISFINIRVDTNPEERLGLMAGRQFTKVNHA